MKTLLFFGGGSMSGRDEKGCKMDVDGRWHIDGRRQTSTVDQVEKSRMVNVDREKVCGINVDRRWSTSTK